MLGFILLKKPTVFSYFGLSILLAYALPLIFASLAQMFVIAAGDVDLGIGPFISLVTCVAAVVLPTDPVFGGLCLLLCVLGYMLLGVLIHVRQLPSIVATLGASFVWYGIALTVLPTPGGSAPEWVVILARGAFPVVPLPIVIAVVAAVVGDILLNRSSYGAVLRGFGANQRALVRSGWSPLFARSTLYTLAGICGVLAGLFMTGLNTAGDANAGTQYTLQSVAAVIIGGGEFKGGVVSPVGSVMGAFIMLLTGSLLSFADVSPNWQLSVQGLLLIVVLSVRRFTRKDKV
jgi:ribose/xylose/arabinose/galactoside ABC-type transport system permease subunit